MPAPPTSRGGRAFAAAAVFVTAACGDARAPSTRPDGANSVGAATSNASASVTPPAGGAPGPSDTALAPAPDSASATPSASTTASAEPVAEPPYQADNKILPDKSSADLDAKAGALLEAIAKNDASLGEAFWFPREAFLKVKDIQDPGAYWKQLRNTFTKDVERFHASKPSWEGAKFVRYEIGSEPKWVKPGEEGNKIGYYRAYRGHVVYEQGGKEERLKVNVVISWQGRWFITHLDKIRR